MKMDQIILLSLLWFSIACRSQKIIVPSSPQTAPPAPNYSSLTAWAAHPAKKDNSDSIPKPFANSITLNNVDIFFIHPTSYLKQFYENNYLADVNNLAINKETDSKSMLYQASVFNQAGKVYAPRYRQVHIRGYYMQNKAWQKQLFDTAYADVKAAFKYYMENYNQGRPIIIASHSQGSTHGMRLLKELFDGKPLQKQLVAAYLIGMSVPQQFFTSIKPCTQPLQTACVCSWRSYRKGFKSSFVQGETHNSIVTNPLTWSAMEPTATRALNKGSILFNFNKLLAKQTGAAITPKVLLVNKPRRFIFLFSRRKNYHVGDINLFYESIKTNSQQRANAFLQNK
jgi:hypothetical protein